MRIVVVGYDTMFANLLLGIKEANENVVGALRYEKIKINPFLLKLKDFFCPSREFSFLKSLKIKDINAGSVNSEEFKNFLIQNNIDVVFVGSWGEKFKKEIYNIPKLGTVNVHPSLLPKYRGPNPYYSVIANKENMTGLTFHLMDEKFDRGAILHQIKIPVLENDNGRTLKDRIVKTARTAVIELLCMFNQGVVIPVNQNEKEATYFSQPNIDNIMVDCEKNSEELDLKIRSLTPWLSLYLQHKKNFFKVSDFEIIKQEKKYLSKTIVAKAKNSITVACADGNLIKFKNLKLYGKFKKHFTNFYIQYFVREGELLY